jgi:hypothetical protein
MSDWIEVYDPSSDTEFSVETGDLSKLEGQSLAQIGAHLGVDHGTVWRQLRKRGVKMRDTHGRER